MTTPGADSTMLELFAAEVDQHLPALSEGLLSLEKGLAGKKEIESMMRAAHSIKGAARIVGNDPAVRVAHIMEDCFTAAKDERIRLSSDSVDILLSGVDALGRICASQPDAELTEPFIQSVLERIATVRDGKPSAPGAATPSAPSPAIVVPSQPPPDKLVLPANLDEPAAEVVRGQLCQLLERGTRRISLDFGQVEQLSVAALSLLLSFAREAQALQPARAIEASGVAPAIQAAFRVVGLAGTFARID